MRRLVVCAVALFVAGISAFGLTAEQLKPLGEDDFEAKGQALETVIASGDDSAHRILEAIRTENLFSNDDGVILIRHGDQYSDALTGATVAAQSTEVSPVTLSNAMRSRAANALAALDLQSDNPATRDAGIDALLRAPDPSLKKYIETAREKATDPGLKARLDQLWALNALQDPDAANRLAALHLIEQRKDPRLAGLVEPLLAKKPDGSWVEPDPQVRAAAQSAMDHFRWEQRKIEFVGNIFAGVSLGSILLLAALGLAITYGLIGVINMAHGEFLMVGAYATYMVQLWFRQYLPGLFDWYPLVAIPFSFLTAALIGVVLERCVIRLLYGRPLETLLTTFGISLIMIQLTRMLFGAQNVQVENPRWMSGGVAIFPELILPYNRICIMIFALLVVIIAWVVLQRTRFGLFIRAVTQNRRMARCVGVKTWQVDCCAFAFGAGIAGLGGCALSQIGNVGPDLGQSYIIDSFMAVVLGGVGQLSGTILGALGLGIITKSIEPFWGAVLAKIAVLVLIVLFIQKRPQGLFALKGRSAEA